MPPGDPVGAALGEQTQSSVWGAERVRTVGKCLYEGLGGAHK